MTSQSRNSVASFMSVLVTIVMWFAAITGVIFISYSAYGLFAYFSGIPLDSLNIEVAEDNNGVAKLISGLLGGIVAIPGIIYVCVQLRRILSTLAKGDPFVPENAGRLTRIAMAILVMQVLKYVVVVCLGMIFSDAEVTLRLDLITWASVAALFILAQVFREGTRLRDEEKMTI